MTKKNEVKVTINSTNSKDFIYSVATKLIESYLSDFTLSEETIVDIRTATSEAITNAFEHAYPKHIYANGGDISISISLKDVKNSEKEKEIKIVIKDKGIGIDNVEKAMAPLFTTSENKAGLGFSVMESFMNKVKVTSKPDKGTTVTLFKKIKV